MKPLTAIEAAAEIKAAVRDLPATHARLIDAYVDLQDPALSAMKVSNSALLLASLPAEEANKGGAAVYRIAMALIAHQCHLTRDEPEAEVLKIIVDLRAAGMSPADIRREFTARGLLRASQ